jgi:protease-4
LRYVETAMKSLFKKTGNFLTSLRIWTINLFTLAFLVYLVVIVVAVVRQMPAAVDPEGKVLILAPEGLVLDQEVYPSNLNFPFSLPGTHQIQSRDLVRVIRAAAQDEGLAGVLLDFSNTAFAGPSTALAIAAELAKLRESGKPVIAFSDVLTTASYMMAAQANEVYVHQSGAVGISGLGGYRDYMRELTENLKLTIHNYSQGDYKSAVDGVTRNDMSEPDRRQRKEFYGPLWTSFKQAMADGRGLEAEVFQAMADLQPVVLIAEGGYDNLAYAEQQGVIDGTKSFPQFRAYMIEKFGRAEDEERETYPHIGHHAYLAQLDEDESESEDVVAVVFVQGALQTGPQGPGVAGSDDIARLIRQAYEAKDTRALVLRVNSPGGSIIASDIIRDELIAAQGKDLPVYVSMGDVAASGGVWVSTPADRIYAERSTLTGSIGVAVAFPTLENVYDYIGVHFDGVTTSEYAGWSPALAVNEELDAIFARWAGGAYEHFVNSVAADREQDRDYIRSIAGGRVWLAPKALELGLIDELGDLEAAISAVAAAAGLEDYRVNYVVQEPSLAFQLLRQFSGRMGIGLDPGYRRWGSRLSEFLSILEGISQPTATVICTECVLELR